MVPTSELITLTLSLIALGVAAVSLGIALVTHRRLRRQWAALCENRCFCQQRRPRALTMAR